MSKIKVTQNKMVMFIEKNQVETYIQAGWKAENYSKNSLINIEDFESKITELEAKLKVSNELNEKISSELETLKVELVEKDNLILAKDTELETLKVELEKIKKTDK